MLTATRLGINAVEKRAKEQQDKQGDPLWKSFMPGAVVAPAAVAPDVAQYSRGHSRGES